MKKGQHLVSPLAGGLGSLLSPPHPQVPWSPSAMADSFLSSPHQKMRDCYSPHPCITPNRATEGTMAATSVSAKGTASPNRRPSKKSCAEKEEPPHLIAQKLFLSLFLVWRCLSFRLAKRSGRKEKILETLGTMNSITVHRICCSPRNEDEKAKDEECWRLGGAAELIWDALLLLP